MASSGRLDGPLGHRGRIGLFLAIHCLGGIHAFPFLLARDSYGEPNVPGLRGFAGLAWFESGPSLWVTPGLSSFPGLQRLAWFA